jgi:hypothetical protein
MPSEQQIAALAVPTVSRDIGSVFCGGSLAPGLDLTMETSHFVAPLFKKEKPAKLPSSACVKRCDLLSVPSNRNGKCA